MSHFLAGSFLLVLVGAPLVEADSHASLRGLMVTATGILWASGANATVLHGPELADAGFQTCSEPPDSTGLDFRGIYARDALHAIVMAAGKGPLSRLYETSDGCATWRLLFTNPDSQGFWDALVFDPYDPKTGVLLGDPVNERFTILRTSDGGGNWTRDTSPALASSPAGEGAFAASNSSLVILNWAGDLLFGTGGLGGPRIFRFDAKAKAWTYVSLKFQVKSETAGIFAVACRSGTECMAVGGDYKNPTNRQDTAFLTRDGGRTWAATSSAPLGYRSAVTFVDGRWIVAGPTGAESSSDDGAHWVSWSNQSWNALSRGWAAGPKGQLAPLQLLRNK